MQAPVLVMSKMPLSSSFVFATPPNPKTSMLTRHVALQTPTAVRDKLAGKPSCLILPLPKRIAPLVTATKPEPSPASSPPRLALPRRYDHSGQSKSIELAKLTRVST